MSIFKYAHYFICQRIAVFWFKWLHWILIFQRLGLSRYGSLGPPHVVFTRNSTDSFPQLFYRLDHASVVAVHCENIFALEDILSVMRNLLVSDHWPGAHICIDFVLHSRCQQHSPRSEKTTNISLCPISTSDVPCSTQAPASTSSTRAWASAVRIILPPAITSGVSDAADWWRCDSMG